MGVSGLWPELIMCASYFTGKRSHQHALNTEDLLSSMFLIQCWNVTVPVLKSSCLWHMWHCKFSWLWCWAPTQTGCWHPWDSLSGSSSAWLWEPQSDLYYTSSLLQGIILYLLQTKGVLRYGFVSTWQEDETGQGSSRCEEPCEWHMLAHWGKGGHSSRWHQLQGDVLQLEAQCDTSCLCHWRMDVSQVPGVCWKHFYSGVGDY